MNIALESKNSHKFQMFPSQRSLSFFTWNFKKSFESSYWTEFFKIVGHAVFEIHDFSKIQVPFYVENLMIMIFWKESNIMEFKKTY